MKLYITSIVEDFKTKRVVLPIRVFFRQKGNILKMHHETSVIQNSERNQYRIDVYVCQKPSEALIHHQDVICRRRINLLRCLRSLLPAAYSSYALVVAPRRPRKAGFCMLNLQTSNTFLVPRDRQKSYVFVNDSEFRWWILGRLKRL